MTQLVLGREGTLGEQEAPDARLAAGTSDPATPLPASLPPPGPAEAATHTAPESSIDSVATESRAPRGHCEWDACAPLEGKQKRFASDACRMAWWEREHPRLNPPDLKRKAPILQLILGILADGEARTIQDISVKCHALPCSVSARIRELRRRGHRIERDARLGDSHKQHRYRLVVS